MVTQAMPVSRTQAVVTVDTPDVDRLGARDVLVTGPDGSLLGVGTLTAGGKAVVPVTVKPSSTMRVNVTIPGADISRSVVTSTSPSSLDTSLWRVVNKVTPIGTYAPRTLRTSAGVQVDVRAAAPMARLIADAGRAGVRIYASNGYRAYGWQQGLYGSYVRRDGALAADTYSARPGYSEHQTGLAFDAKNRDERCSLEPCFGATPGGRWLAEHAAAYGFVVRYTAQNSVITGYSPEPWHLRYVGPWLTAYLKESGEQSLEVALGMPAAPDYIGPNTFPGAE
ncbi:M15 family metallopeptidase [Luteipulveratus sp. YIM 133132]|uniref:M15 family metallopeptidase n=1 Tax=Luteipulveratus flavus TaxID=3031728 RepID=A0ABT6C6T1_9MICO|nr:MULTISPECIES: M15 family metallopeptidase [unclassified Luteipulveratus]MDE9365014.1 M15 family metallopeptidase [Luteipulveratus sp. YIM 133132]MDF8264646.1 M15 family metallopeptidase [Luteipulveratus sp. YIM 133296]